MSRNMELSSQCVGVFGWRQVGSGLHLSLQERLRSPPLLALEVVEGQSKGFPAPSPLSGALKPAAPLGARCLGPQEEGRMAEEAKPQFCSQTRWP